MSISAREPLVIRTAVVAAITGALHAAVVLGWLPIDADAEAAIAGAVDLLGTAVAVVWSRGAVTPVADPDLSGSLADVEYVESDEPVDAEYEPQHAAE